MMTILTMDLPIRCQDTSMLSRSDEVLLESVLAWFNDHPQHLNMFLTIVKRKDGLSLRVIDWLVTNYSKTHSITINTHGIPRDLYRDYHKNLSSLNKCNFDPFCRRQKIQVVVFGKEERCTTIGQMTFFRWFLKNNIITFLKKNKKLVETHMKTSEKLGADKKRVKPRIISSKSYTGKFKMEF